MIFTGANQRLVATRSKRRGRRYRYYSTRADDRPSAVAEGKAWYERIKSGEFPTLRALARTVGRDRPEVGRTIRLAFLAPNIVAAIVGGEQPNTLTIGALLRDRDIPLSWPERRRLFGFRDPGAASR